MAPRLKQGQTTDANVVRLQTRKAKGAGGAKRKGPSTTRMKPKAHEEKPKRQTAAQKAAEKAFAAPAAAAAAQPASVPARPIAAQPSDAEIRRGLQDRLVALNAKLKPVEAKLAAQQDVASQLRSDKQSIRGQIQAIIPLSVYDELRKKLDAKTKRADNEQYEKLRALAFEAFALPCGPTAELNLEGLPEAGKPAAYWEERGYQAGVNNETSDPTRDGVPPENTQDYCQGYARAMEANARGIKQLASPLPATAPRPLPPASIPGAEQRMKVSGVDAAGQPVEETITIGVDPGAPGGDLTARLLHIKTEVFTGTMTLGDNGQPDWSNFAENPDDWSQVQHAVFNAWYATLGPNDDIDIVHIGVEAAFDAAAEAEELAAAAPAPAAEASEMI